MTHFYPEGVNQVIDNYQEDYLRKTIEVKNKNIDELLKELRETQQLYQSYKSQYLEEEKKMKRKIGEIQNQVAFYVNQVEKEKMLTGRLKNQLQIAHEKEHKLRESQIFQAHEFKSAVSQLDQKCRRLGKENNDLKIDNENLLGKYVKLEEKSNKSQSQEASMREEIRQLRQQLSQNSVKWQIEKAELLDRIQQQEEKKKQKTKVNHRLDQLEQKILTNMKKI